MYTTVVRFTAVKRRSFCNRFLNCQQRQPRREQWKAYGWDRRTALKDLLDFSLLVQMSEREDAARQFIKRHGPLRSMIADKQVPAEYSSPEVFAVAFASSFFATTLEMLRADRPSADRQDRANNQLSIIFRPARIARQDRPSALRFNLLAGTVEPIPRDSLDALTMEFMHSHRLISRCEHCHLYFFRVYANDRYCTPLCGEEARREGQREWMRVSRQKQKERRQAERKTPKRIKAKRRTS